MTKLKNPPNTRRLWKVARIIWIFVIILVVFVTWLGSLQNKPIPNSADVTSANMTPAVTPPANQLDAQQEVDADPMPTLPGLMRVDVSANLERSPYSFEFGPEQGTGIKLQTVGTREDSDTGDHLVVTMNAIAGNVYAVNASVTGANLTAAQWLLPYVATLPFTGNDGAESKEWVLANLGKASEGHPITRTAYGAYWQLERSPRQGEYLNITPEGLNDWGNRHP
jgi:hypothetical protein